MSVTIRLSRIGKRNAPSYKIVVANTRDKREGRFLDMLGHYNPSHNPPLLSIDKDKYKQWKEKGALSTDAVDKLVEGTYEYKKYIPVKEGEKKEKARSNESKEKEESKPKEEKQQKDKEK